MNNDKELCLSMYYVSVVMWDVQDGMDVKDNDHKTVSIQILLLYKMSLITVTHISTSSLRSITQNLHSSA